MEHPVLLTGYQSVMGNYGSRIPRQGVANLVQTGFKLCTFTLPIVTAGLIETARRGVRTAMHYRATLLFTAVSDPKRQAP